MHTISIEIARRLPSVARDRLVRLDRQCVEATAISRETSTQVQDKQFAIKQSERDLEIARLEGGARGSLATSQRTHHLAHMTASATNRDDDSLIKELEKRHETLKADLSELVQRQRFCVERARAILALRTSIENWLQKLPPTIAIAAHDEKPLRGREVGPEQLESRRQRIREVLADLGQLDAAPHTGEAAKKKAREEIDRLAELGRPDVRALVERLEDVRWPDRELDVRVAGLAGSAGTPDGMALVVWLCRDALVAAIDKEIDAAADGHGLTDDQRAERFRVCLSDLLQAERDEEAIIQAAAFDVIRRADADPRAVLCLSSTLPSPRREALQHAPMITELQRRPA